MDKKFWGILAVIAVILVGVFWFTNNNKANAPSSSSQPTQHTEGKGTSNVTLVEYGDYECPYCGQYYPVVKQVVAYYGDKITFQFRNLPLTQIHPNAYAGARAAEAASLQGKFWQMHDLLYTNQNDWVNSSDPTTVFDSYAQQLGLNVTQFKQDYASEKVNNFINADVSAFGKTGAQEATPAFFLDGKQVQPSETVDSFKKLIDAEIAKKTGQPASSTSSSSSSSSTSNNAPQSKQ
jgi:protein-disulfide isomerase